MYIENIRAGFATNSSSTHSIIVLPENIKIDDYADDTYDLSYGWQNFVLASPEAKMQYFAAQLYNSMFYSDKKLPLSTVVAVIQDITGVNILDFSEVKRGSYDGGDPYLPDVSIDHQSSWNLRGIDADISDHKDFLLELAEYIKKDSIVIFGGNDNSDGNPFIPSSGKEENKMSRIIDNGCKIIRKDGDYYTFFNNVSGMKIRITLKDNAPRYTKSTTPELVDLKITQFCPFACQFCYMSSTKEGVHAPLERIKEYIDKMHEMRVMEIALGGGEPTMHPNFVEILEYINQKNMVANFTTFSVHWLKDDKIVQAVKKYASAIGVSVLNNKCLDKVRKIDKTLNESKNYYSRVQIMAQHVLGSIDPAETINILTNCWSERIPVLLLGYKKVGFGKTYAPHSANDVLAFLKLSYRNEKYFGAKCNFLAVDTKFVSNFKKFIQDMGVSSKLITNSEGKFSMYMDAVEGKIAASSYCSPKKYADMPEKTSDLIKIYSTY